MARSLANGDYSLLMAVESSSRPNSWYRTLANRATGGLSCDCPPYIFHQDDTDPGMRSCPHTRFGISLLQRQDTTARPNTSATTHVSPLIHAMQEQWPGLRGQWQIEERDTRINNKPYHVILLRLLLGNGGEATGTAAFSQHHPITQERLRAGVAGWCGYAIAAEVARLGGFPLAGQPPEHFKVRSTGGSRAPRRQPTAASCIGLSDILRGVGDQLDLGDGLRPMQRAENTLRLFLGEQLYAQLEQQEFLDVSSVQHQDRVYRVRRDPTKARERRVRVFEQGSYAKDFCIVRAQDVPEADHFLTVFLGLLSDEQTTLSVVQSYNVFGPYSDGREQERLPACWQPRIGEGGLRS